jgi:uncharacterized protein YndB with AHSA1/START domain
MKTIQQTYTIHATVSVVWQALVNPKEIDRWGGGPVKMDAKEGTKFSLWGGSIWGKNIEVIPEKKLVQEWYSEEERTWDKPSIAEFTLHAKGDKVQLDLIHTDVPDEYAASIEDGWKDYYLGALKDFVEKK